MVKFYLEEFIKEHNNKFAKIPVSSEDIHRNLLPHMQLDEILCFKTLKTVSYNLTFQHNRQLYLLEETSQIRGLRRKQISLCEYPEGHIKVLYNSKELQYQMIYDRLQQILQGEIITDNKYLNDVLEAAATISKNTKSLITYTDSSRAYRLKDRDNPTFLLWRKYDILTLR